MRFKNRVAVVTGASVGIGRATALAFSNEGCRVALVDIDDTGGKAALQAAQAGGAEAALIRADVSREDQVQSMVAEVVERWGRLDILVNNAGIYVQGKAAETESSDWSRVLEVNLSGAFLCTKYALAVMMEAEGGVIINIASEAGLVGIGGQVAYNVSKAGLIALTRSCAVDYAPHGVRVNCVCPGTTDTPLVQEAVARASDPAEARRRLERIRPLNRLGTPEEIASAILYLASDAAAYATGSILSIDGGYTAQ